MSWPVVYNLSELEWRQDVAHRRECRDALCDRMAHRYAKAHAERRVLINGVAVDEDGLPMADDVLDENGLPVIGN